MNYDGFAPLAEVFLDSVTSQVIQRIDGDWSADSRSIIDCLLNLIINSLILITYSTIDAILNTSISSDCMVYMALTELMIFNGALLELNPSVMLRPLLVQLCLFDLQELLLLLLQLI